VSPYSSWATAATNIQDAVDAGFPSGTILVSNGVYRATRGAIVLNAVVPHAIRSVNGPAVTFIDGYHTNFCADLTSGTVLSGFTLTNGTGYYAVFPDTTGHWVGGAVGGRLTNCVLAGNSAAAAYAATLIDCVLSSNSDGGAYFCTLTNCILSTNLTDGASQCTLSHCVLNGHSGYGARFSTLYNCVLTANSYGVGQSVLNGCALIGNYIGANGSTLTNCTVTGNRRGTDGGCNNYNCLIYYNSEWNFENGSSLENCCTMPMPLNGVNITNEPGLSDATHLGAASACIGAGNAAYVHGADIDGEPWANPPSIGCDEFHAGAVNGPLTVSLTADHTNVATGFVVNFTPQVTGHASFNFLDFDDGTFVFNKPFAFSHAFTAPGDYEVMLVAYNASFPDGVIASVTIHVLSNPVQYVALNSASPAAPYTSWATAAINIQDAVDQAFQGGTILVSNGVYQTGSRVTGPYYPNSAKTNRLAVTSPVPIRSLNGPLVTTIDGGGEMWCAFLTNGASLTGFTLRNGVGGVEGGSLSNCIVVANLGDGADQATLVNCAVVNNQGYGAYFGSLRNCTLIGNRTGAWAPMDNCIAYFNRTNYNSPQDSPINFSCTTPLPADGYGYNNISAEPQLTDSLHLAAGSPCRAAGPAGSTAGADIDGEAWLATPAIGCDEFYSGATGPLTILASADYTNVAVGFPVNFSAAILGHALSNRWDFGDGTLANNLLFQPFTSHSWSVPGDYNVALRAYNATYAAGVSATVTVHVVAQPIHYVSLASPNPVAPFAGWATAATNIQQAVDAASIVGALVLVSNGVYQTGGQLAPGSDSNSNRLTVLKPVIVQSLNGPAVTHIKGGSQTRCAYLTNNAWLIGFTLTNGAAMSTYPTYLGGGGGVHGGSVSNCTLAGNSASGDSAPGGGAYASTLYNCLLTNNASGANGGGAHSCLLSGCTLVTNRAAGGGGGGAHSCFLSNCILSNNVAAYGGGVYAGTLTNCMLARNRGGNGGGGAGGAVLLGCTLVSNTGLSFGGGAYSCALTNCLLSGNSAYQGGGSYYSTLDTCVFAANSASSSGGGDYESTLLNCTLTNNTASNGGGVDSSSVHGGILARNFATNDGGAAYDYASVQNCTVSDNTAGQKGGGGALWSTFVNCTLTGNFATLGGGASQSDLYNCVLTDNSASDSGGGAHQCNLVNCTLVDNVANNFGGGAYEGYPVSSILYYNSASDFPNVFPNQNAYSAADHCCTTPMPTNGVWCITNQPTFVNLATGNYRLQTNSLCINAGNNSLANQSAPDLDGNPRVAGGTVDIGAYEYQNPSSIISYAWLKQYDLAMDGSADHGDPDGDHFDNYQEWSAGTSPLDASSLLRILSVTLSTNDVDWLHATITFQSVPGMGYVFQRATNLVPNAVFEEPDSIYATSNTTSYTDYTPVTNGPAFYRIRVQ
jgi:PKD repeat protein